MRRWIDWLRNVGRRLLAPPPIPPSDPAYTRLEREEAQTRAALAVINLRLDALDRSANHYDNPVDKH